MSPKLLVIADLNMRQRGPCRVAPVRRAAPAAPYFCPRVPVPCYYCRACTSLLLFFPFLLAFFSFFFPSVTSLFPFDPSTGVACRKPGNVTSLIIGVVKRVVRNNYEPVPRRRRVTRARAVLRSFVVVGSQSISSLALGGEVSDL